ncbi:MAG: hypothetical protein RMJ98_02355 [Myxococcales bacterium]|nr:hypothetical protein [Myxococcales bacterium]
MAEPQGTEREKRFEEPQAASPSSLSLQLRLLLGASIALTLGAWGLLMLRFQGAAAVALGGGLAVFGAVRAVQSRRKPPARGLVLRGRKLLFDDASGEPLQLVASLEERFGVTMLANRARSRAALAITSSRSVFFVGAQVDRGELPRCRAALASAFTVASDERALEPVGPDGLPLQLTGAGLVKLYEGLLQLDPGCIRRFFLTDVRGDRVVLDHRVLSVGSHTFDLDAKLDWRGSLFQEVGLGGIMIYQATQVRQGGHDLVFVSLMPALFSPTNPGDLASEDTLLERAAQRDLSLLRDSSGDPPPVERRVAIDRVFMLPLRAALQAASRRRDSGAHRPVA